MQISSFGGALSSVYAKKRGCTGGDTRTASKLNGIDSIVNNFVDASEEAGAFISFNPPIIFTVRHGGIWLLTEGSLVCAAALSECSFAQQQHSEDWLMEQYLTMVVNPEEKNNTVLRSVIDTVIWSFDFLITVC